MRRDSLTEIANEEATDKGTVGPTTWWPCHNYTDIYDAYLHPYRTQKVTLVEIGLGVKGPNWNTQIAQGRNARGGASLRMWYRYFERARIFGLDINSATYLDSDRITTAIIDQGDPEQLRYFAENCGVSEFNIVVDDGSHLPEHQQISLGVLFPFLGAGGYYFIEDLLDNGQGDQFQRSGCSVLSTRKVLKQYKQVGKLPEPNAISNREYLQKAIGSISFHCPAVRARNAGDDYSTLNSKMSPKTGRSNDNSAPQVQFISGTEKLCVIRKGLQKHG